MSKTFVLHNNNAKKLMTNWPKEIIRNQVTYPLFHHFKWIYWFFRIRMKFFLLLFTFKEIIFKINVALEISTFFKQLLAKLQYTAPWRRGERNPLVFWVCSYFGFVLVCLRSERSERSPRGNAEESYTAILPNFFMGFKDFPRDWTDSFTVKSFFSKKVFFNT